MKLKPLQIGQLNLTPKMLIALAGALFIFGVGLGVTIASNFESSFALIGCSIISILMVAYTLWQRRYQEPLL
jgi:uncharacterized transporter YbjL